MAIDPIQSDHSYHDAGVDGVYACIVKQIFKKLFAGKEVVPQYLRELSDKELKASRKILEDAGVTHDVKIKTEEVAQEISDYADKGKYELIVLGAKGRGAIADLLIGSVAQRVLATAKVPVLLVK